MNRHGEHTIKEIRQQKDSFAYLRDHIDTVGETTQKAFAFQPEQVIFMGCGSSYYIAATAAIYFQTVTGIPARHVACYEMELHRKAYIGDKRTLIVPFTRSGATTEVRSAVTKCLQLPQVKSLSITCDPRTSEYNTYMILCGNTDETSIVMTSSFTSMTYAAMLVANLVGKKSTDSLLKLPEQAQEYLPMIEEKAKVVAQELVDKTFLVCLGQGPAYGIAGESSIKIKEMCLIPTEIYYSLEYRHGPISIASEQGACLFIADHEVTAEEVSLLKDIKGYGMYLITCAPTPQPELESLSDQHFSFGQEPVAMPLLTVPAQYLGTYWAIAKGLNPDTPRNLSKAIVLE